MRTSELVASSMALVLLLGSPRAAFCAEPSAVELEAARKLFDDGVRQEEAGDWAGALATFRKVAAVKASAAVHFHLGLCLEKTGKWVEAISEFRASEHEAKAQPDIAERAKAHGDALRARIPSVILVPPSPAPSLTITIDGQPIAAALVGAQLPLDPGAHSIEVRAPGYRVFSRDVELEERVVERVQLTLVPEKAPSSTTIEGGTRFGAWPWIAGGVAVVGLASAGVFYGLSAREASRLEDNCAGGRCPESERDTYDRGRAFTTTGNVLVIVGSVAAATAITLFVFNKGASESGRVAASANGVSLSLSF